MGRYLVTGGAGFIGSQLTGQLLENGDEIVCIDNFNDFYDPQIKADNIKEFKDNEKFSLERGDIIDKDFLEDVFNKYSFDQVIHLAARAGVRPSIKDPLLYEEVNVKGTINILECLKKHNISKMVFASSSSVYGVNQKVPFSEGDLLQQTISPYAVTKVAGELMCYSYSHLYNMAITCLRFFTVYGPCQRPEMAIHKFTRAIFNGEEIPVFGDGLSQRDYTFVDDIVVGIRSAIEKKFAFEIINLGNSYAVKLKDLIAVLERAIGKKAKIKRLEAQPGDVPVTYACIDKAKRMLNYNPQTRIEAGVEKFVTWYRKNNNL